MIAEHNCRSLCTFLEVDGKIIKQWDGVSLEKIAAQPHTFYHLEQKFVLKWIYADPDSDLQDTFALEANGADLSSLEYMSPDFKLVDEDPAFFDATVIINDEEEPVHAGSFEWRAGTLSHKITECIQDETIRSVEMFMIMHSSVVTSESLSLISRLNLPDTGFEQLVLSFGKLDEKISQTVVD